MSTADAEFQRKVAELEAIYKKAMDALNHSRTEQLRIIDEYIRNIKDQRLQELRRSIIAVQQNNNQ